MSFIETLHARWQSSNSLLCVGLDPDRQRLPAELAGEADAIFQFNKAIVDATHDLVCAYKPQIAYFAAEGAEDQLQRTIDYIHNQYPGIPVLLDAKRGDIGSTASQYAVEAFERFEADAVTLNPYLGFDSIEPFLAREDKGIIVLCRTSNASAADFQDLEVDGEPLFMRVAKQVCEQWNANGNCMLVVGATWPSQMQAVRSIAGDVPFLVPGVGVQGGDVEALVGAGRTADGTGLVVNAARSILYASSGADFANAAREAALSLQQQINQYR